MNQLSQWVNPTDLRHLQGVCEPVGAILLSQKACPAHWLAYLIHRDCSARSDLERIHYWLENPHPSTSVAFEDYQAVLERTYKQIPPGCSVTLLADRGFARQHLLQWLQAHQ